MYLIQGFTCAAEISAFSLTFDEMIVKYVWVGRVETGGICGGVGTINTCVINTNVEVRISGIGSWVVVYHLGIRFCITFENINSLSISSSHSNEGKQYNLKI